MSLSIVFKYLFWLWTASEILILVVTRTGRKGGQVKDRGSLLILWPVIFCSITAAIWCGESHQPTMWGGAPWLKLLALLLLIAGLAVRWTAIWTLGRSFSANVAIHATQTLNRSGLFRWVRHPSYSGMLLIFAAVGIRERNWVSLAIMLVFPTAALLYRIHVEEMALTEAFGPEYTQYQRETKRLLPGIY
jgi:protein-S-isoprenylcysteine O-methyltransferase Ste14